MKFNDITVKGIYEEIYYIAENSKSDEARLRALLILLNLKRDEEQRVERREALAQLVSSVCPL